MNYPDNRAEAIRIKAPLYNTKKPCIHGHTSERRTKSGCCVECGKERSTKYRNDNPEYQAAIIKVWNQANKDKCAGYTAKYRALKKLQTPIDADEDKIAEFYRTASELNEIYNSTLQVDHIRSLKNYGLHHEDNLQLITKTQNCQKGTKDEAWIHPNQIDEQIINPDCEIIKWLKSV